VKAKLANVKYWRRLSANEMAENDIGRNRGAQ
jgi:hypothetical protein